MMPARCLVGAGSNMPATMPGPSGVVMTSNPPGGMSTMTSNPPGGLSAMTSNPPGGLSTMISNPPGGMSVMTSNPSGGMSAMASNPPGGMSAMTSNPPGGMSAMTSNPPGNLSTMTSNPHGSMSAMTSNPPGNLSTMTSNLHGSMSAMTSYPPGSLSTITPNPPGGLSAMLQMSSSVGSMPEHSIPMPKPPIKYYSLYSKELVESKQQPPPPPAPADSYKMFGLTFQVNDPVVRSLESQCIRRLYPQNADHKKELKKFNHSIVVNFLDLLDILVKSPGRKEREDKITDLNLLFIQMHHLINEFRPSEARETLRVMLEMQKSVRVETAESFQWHLDKVKDLLSYRQTSMGEAKKSGDVKPKTNQTDGNIEMDKYLLENADCDTRDLLLCEQADLFSKHLAQTEHVAGKS